MQSFSEAVTLEAALRHAAVVNLAENRECFVESSQPAKLHELGKFAECAVPVGLADNAGAIDVDEQRRDFVSASTQVAVGRLTFAHSYLFSFTFEKRKTPPRRREELPSNSFARAETKLKKRASFGSSAGDKKELGGFFVRFG
jgi:hypothetical protein